MELTTHPVLSKGSKVNDQYTVLLFINQGANAQTYRVKTSDGKVYFFKLFNYSKLHRTQFDNAGNLLEVEFLKKCNNRNVVNYKDSGELILENQKYAFLVLDFITGETIAQKLVRENTLSAYEVKQIGIGILNGLNYLHTLSEPVIHNEITAQNIMLDLSGDSPEPKIIDFGYARSFYQSTKSYNREGLNPYYLAPECFNNVFSPQSDIFSVGALMYQLLFGVLPWSSEISKYKADKTRADEMMEGLRSKPLTVPNLNSNDFDLDDNLINTIKKSLQLDSSLRFKSATEFIQAINGEITVEDVKVSSPSVSSEPKSEMKTTKQVSSKSKAKGFAKIAGMQHLKDELKNDVIDVLANPEEYKKHNLGIPNGMLLYGPPGCGKTFFAESFAEETGYNFIKVVSSDLASIYVHGSQEKIGKLFKEAREKAPTILYFDELDAMVPNREKVNNQSQSGEVNEFLSQLDNIGDSGVFVIGSTNKPESIDKAVLRAGRLEKWFFIPPPDFEARKEMFELYLKERPLDFGIDYSELASLTENYVSSDIRLIIDETSRKSVNDYKKGLTRSSHITMQNLLHIIKSRKPTVALSEIKKYEAIRRKLEDDIDESSSDDFSSRTPIGFKPKP